MTEPAEIPSPTQAPAPAPADQGLPDNPIPNGINAPAPTPPVEPAPAVSGRLIDTPTPIQPIGEPTPAPTQPIPPAVDWKETHIPEKYRSDPYIGLFKDAESFMEGVRGLKNLAGKKGLEKPVDGATEQQWDDYWKAVGRPDSPDDYKYESLKDSANQPLFEFEDSTLKPIKEEMFKHGLTNDQVQANLDIYANLQIAEAEAQVDIVAAERMQTVSNLTSAWGDQYESNVTRAYGIMDHLGLGEFVESKGLEANEALLRAMHALSSEYSEAVIGPKGSTKTVHSELTELESSPAYHNANDPKHKEVISRRLALLKQLGS